MNCFEPSYYVFSPQFGHGVYTTPVDFYLIKKRFPSSQWNKIL